MYVILIPAKIVEHVFQQIRHMTANVLWGGPGHTVKVSGTSDDNVTHFNQNYLRDIA